MAGAAAAAAALGAELVKKCSECPAACTGVPLPIWQSMSEEARAYQARVTGFPYHVEFFYNGTYFDGFQGPCVLVEAKHKYAQFLDPQTNNRTWAPWFAGGVKMLSEAMRQSISAVPRPPISLKWCFFEVPVMTLMRTTFNASGLSHIITVHVP
jgi:hypothetical protein